MNDLLVIAALVFVVVHQNSDRAAVLIFSVPLLIYGIMDEFLPPGTGTYYHLGAVAVDLAIIYYLSRLAHVSELIHNIAKGCEAFIYINALGWIAYMEYIPHYAYNNTCTVIYIWILVKIIQGGSWGELRDFALDWWFSWVYRGNRASGFAQASYQEAIRT